MNRDIKNYSTEQLVALAEYVLEEIPDLCDSEQVRNWLTEDAVHFIGHINAQMEEFVCLQGDG